MTRIVPAAALALALLLNVSCGRKQDSGMPVSRIAEEEKGDPVQEPSVPPDRADSRLSVRILPVTAGTGTRLHLSASEFSLGDGEIAWTVDGEPVRGEHGDSLSTEELRKGMSIQAQVKVGGQEIASNIVTIRNTPPEIRSVRIVPEAIRPGDSIGVEVAGEDRDGDVVTFEYQWERNGEPAGTGSRMEGALRRNDVFSVRITPFDGEAKGQYLVVRREVKNYPPAIAGAFDARLEDGVYSCRIGATDGDGDPLTYALKESPPGMTIDAATGTIRWKVPSDYQGKVPVAVSVSDGKGGDSSYAMVVTIREEPAK